MAPATAPKTSRRRKSGCQASHLARSALFTVRLSAAGSACGVGPDRVPLEARDNVSVELGDLTSKCRDIHFVRAGGGKKAARLRDFLYGGPPVFGDEVAKIALTRRLGSEDAPKKADKCQGRATQVWRACRENERDCRFAARRNRNATDTHM